MGRWIFLADPGYKAAGDPDNIAEQITHLNAVEASHWRIWTYVPEGATLVLSAERSREANCAFAVFKGVSRLKLDTYWLPLGLAAVMRHERPTDVFSYEPSGLAAPSYRVNIGSSKDQFVTCDRVVCYTTPGADGGK